LLISEKCQKGLINPKKERGKRRTVFGQGCARRKEEVFFPEDEKKGEPFLAAS